MSDPRDKNQAFVDATRYSSSSDEAGDGLPQPQRRKLGVPSMLPATSGPNTSPRDNNQAFVDATHSSNEASDGSPPPPPPTPPAPTQYVPYWASSSSEEESDATPPPQRRLSVQSNGGPSNPVPLQATGGGGSVRELHLLLTSNDMLRTLLTTLNADDGLYLHHVCTDSNFGAASRLNKTPAPDDTRKIGRRNLAKNETLDTSLMYELLSHKRGPWSINLGETAISKPMAEKMLDAVRHPLSRVSFFYLELSAQSPEIKKAWTEAVRTNQVRIQRGHCDYKVPWYALSKYILNAEDDPKPSTYRGIAQDDVNKFILKKLSTMPPRQTVFDPANCVHNKVCEAVDSAKGNLTWFERVFTDKAIVADHVKLQQMCKDITKQMLGADTTFAMEFVTVAVPFGTDGERGKTKANVTLFVPLTTDWVYRKPGTPKIKKSGTKFNGKLLSQTIGNIMACKPGVTYEDSVHTRKNHTRKYMVCTSNVLE